MRPGDSDDGWSWAVLAWLAVAALIGASIWIVVKNAPPPVLLSDWANTVTKREAGFVLILIIAAGALGRFFTRRLGP